MTEVSHLPSHLDLCALSLRPQTELKPRQIRWSRKSEPGNIGKATEARDWFLPGMETPGVAVILFDTG